MKKIFYSFFSMLLCSASLGMKQNSISNLYMQPDYPGGTSQEYYELVKHFIAQNEDSPSLLTNMRKEYDKITPKLQEFGKKFGFKEYPMICNPAISLILSVTSSENTLFELEKMIGKERIGSILGDCFQKLIAGQSHIEEDVDLLISKIVGSGSSFLFDISCLKKERQNEFVTILKRIMLYPDVFTNSHGRDLKGNDICLNIILLYLNNLLACEKTLPNIPKIKSFKVPEVISIDSSWENIMRIIGNSNEYQSAIEEDPHNLHPNAPLNLGCFKWIVNRYPRCSNLTKEDIGLIISLIVGNSESRLFNNSQMDQKILLFFKKGLNYKKLNNKIEVDEKKLQDSRIWYRLNLKDSKRLADFVNKINSSELLQKMRDNSPISRDDLNKLTIVGDTQTVAELLLPYEKDLFESKLREVLVNEVGFERIMSLIAFNAFPFFPFEQAKFRTMEIFWSLKGSNFEPQEHSINLDTKQYPAKDLGFVILHEVTHAFHDAIELRLKDLGYQENWLVNWSIFSSGLMDRFFPAFFHLSQMKAQKKDGISCDQSKIRTIAQNAMIYGFGQFLLSHLANENRDLSLDKLLHDEVFVEKCFLLDTILPQNSTSDAHDINAVWDTSEEILTMQGILPFWLHDKIIVIEDSQNEFRFLLLNNKQNISKKARENLVFRVHCSYDAKYPLADYEKFYALGGPVKWTPSEQIYYFFPEFFEMGGSKFYPQMTIPYLCNNKKSFRDYDGKDTILADWKEGKIDFPNISFPDDSYALINIFHNVKKDEAAKNEVFSFIKEHNDPKTNFRVLWELLEISDEQLIQDVLENCNMNLDLNKEGSCFNDVLKESLKKGSLSVFDVLLELCIKFNNKNFSDSFLSKVVEAGKLDWMTERLNTFLPSNPHEILNKGESYPDNVKKAIIDMFLQKNPNDELYCTLVEFAMNWKMDLSSVFGEINTNALETLSQNISQLYRMWIAAKRKPEYKAVSSVLDKLINRMVETDKSYKLIFSEETNDLAE